MCGRYVLKSPLDEIIEEYQLDEAYYEEDEDYNIAPGSWIPNIIESENKRLMQNFYWGLIPSWSKDQSFAAKTFNARVETLTEKASFKAAYKRRRSIIPANGYYEWKKEGKNKKPSYIFLKNNKLMSMAGLWESWNSPDGSLILSCSIITTKACNKLKDIHHRMPLILDKDTINIWLHHKTEDTEHLKEFLIPYDSNKLDLYLITTYVNSVKNNSPKCIEKDEPLELF